MYAQNPGNPPPVNPPTFGQPPIPGNQPSPGFPPGNNMAPPQPGIIPQPTPPPPPPGWGGPGFLATPPQGDWMNNGTINVMATGYDSEGVLKQIPLVVSYSFNGVTYNVTVLNAWNPYTETWNIGIDAPAFTTTFSLNGFTYNYYAPLSLGTFYFNL